MTMHDILATQRAAFTAELPVSLNVRKDRLKRAAAMIADNADRFCDALSEDFGHRSREQSMLTDIAASVAPLKHGLRQLERDHGGRHEHAVFDCVHRLAGDADQFRELRLGQALGLAHLADAVFEPVSQARGVPARRSAAAR